MRHYERAPVDRRGLFVFSRRPSETAWHEANARALTSLTHRGKSNPASPRCPTTCERRYRVDRNDQLTLFPAMMAFAASSDLLTMTIANRVSLILIAGFVGAGVATRDERRGSAVACSAPRRWCLLWRSPALRCGWIGGGDAKLAAATALWLGFDHLFDYLIYASLLGGALTLAARSVPRRPLPRLLVGQAWAERLHRRGRRRALWHRARGGRASGLSADRSGWRRSALNGAIRIRRGACRGIPLRIRQRKINAI